ncbi:hypothetical protein [Corynebacterium kalidii]
MTTRKHLRPEFSDDTGVVFPCPLCHHRVLADDTTEAWRGMYRHVRSVHRTAHDARLTEQVRRAYKDHRRNHR